jgi:hypothetical protein
MAAAPVAGEGAVQDASSLAEADAETKVATTATTTTTSTSTISIGADGGNIEEEMSDEDDDDGDTEEGDEEEEDGSSHSSATMTSAATIKPVGIKPINNSDARGWNSIDYAPNISTSAQIISSFLPPNPNNNIQVSIALSDTANATGLISSVAISGLGVPNSSTSRSDSASNEQSKPIYDGVDEVTDRNSGSGGESDSADTATDSHTDIDDVPIGQLNHGTSGISSGISSSNSRGSAADTPPGLSSGGRGARGRGRPRGRPRRGA